MIILLHEHQIGTSEENNLQPKRQIAWPDEIPHTADSLQRHIDPRHYQMRHLQLVCHNLIHMLLMRFHQVLTQQDTVQDGEPPVNAIHDQHRHPAHRLTTQGQS